MPNKAFLIDRDGVINKQPVVKDQTKAYLTKKEQIELIEGSAEAIKILEKESNTYDSVDYIPAKNWLVLFGHHFASIAGAGPIIGPILAVGYFGWLPTVLWILCGVVFIGAVHDYATLMASVRNKGRGISNLAKDYLGKRSGWIFGFMLLVTLILVLTVFSVSTADSFIKKPELVIPVLGITFLSLVLGFVVEKTKINYKLASLVAIILVFIGEGWVNSLVAKQKIYD